MQTYQRIWLFRTSGEMGGKERVHLGSPVIRHFIVVVAVLGLVLVGSGLGARMMRAFAMSPCSSGDQVYSVVSGDTLGGIATRYAKPPVRGTGDYFPYGQCTWWASYRYFQLHGIYVPWKTQADAWEWTNRARDFHWHISSTPSQGAIINLQPWVEGAYGLGHVAVVEKVLKNGHVIASNMNWGVYYWEVTDVEFTRFSVFQIILWVRHAPDGFALITCSYNSVSEPSSECEINHFWQSNGGSPGAGWTRT